MEDYSAWHSLLWDCYICISTTCKQIFREPVNCEFQHSNKPWKPVRANHTVYLLLPSLSRTSKEMFLWIKKFTILCDKNMDWLTWLRGQVSCHTCFQFFRHLAGNYLMQFIESYRNGLWSLHHLSAAKESRSCSTPRKESGESDFFFLFLKSLFLVLVLFFCEEKFLLACPLKATKYPIFMRAQSAMEF